MVGFRNRYLVMEVLLDPSKDLGKEDPIIITQTNVLKAIRDSILLNFGECGYSASLGSLQVKHVNPITKVCIIRTAREEYQKVWCSITMIKSIGNCPVIFNLMDLSGSIKACKAAALKHEEVKFEQYKQVMGDRLPPDSSHKMHNYLAKIQLLEH